MSLLNFLSTLIYRVLITLAHDPALQSDTIFLTLKRATFEVFRNCSESVGFDANNELQEDVKKVIFLKTTKVLYLQKFGAYVSYLVLVTCFGFLRISVVLVSTT